MAKTKWHGSSSQIHFLVEEIPNISPEYESAVNLAERFNDLFLSKVSRIRHALAAPCVHMSEAEMECTNSVYNWPNLRKFDPFDNVYAKADPEITH